MIYECSKCEATDCKLWRELAVFTTAPSSQPATVLLSLIWMEVGGGIRVCHLGGLLGGKGFQTVGRIAPYASGPANWIDVSIVASVKQPASE
jgi:hypothetical protein